MRDLNGCKSFISNDITIDPLPALMLDVDVSNAVINCKGDKTGVIVATATGALGNYVYTLLDGAGLPIVPTPTQNSPGNFTQLGAGNYIVSVVSKDCDPVTRPVSIQEPATSITATFDPIAVTCNGNNDGKIAMTASGGIGMIKYAISPILNQFFVGNIAGGHIFKDLKPGTYDVLVQDENGCYILNKAILITQPNLITIATVPGSIKQELCVGEKTGAFSIEINGGTMPYSVSLDDEKGVYTLGTTTQTQFDFAGLSGGNHTAFIKDANGCTSEWMVALDPAVLLDPKAIPTYDCVDNLPANKVTVTIDSSNNSADVKYSLDGSGTEQASNVFTNLLPGDHFVVAHHKNGCVDATPVFNIKEVKPLSISIDLGGLNEIVATATGGSGVYQFNVNGEDIGSNNKYIYYKSGNYTVTVTDTNGCFAAATKYFEFIDIFIPPIFTPTGDGQHDTWRPTNTENYPDIKFVVYDRYGREVGTFGAGEFWDGRYKGTELPMGDYWYVLKLRNSKDDREFIGHFTLYR